MAMMLCRWWRGRELQQKYERSMKGCREKEKRGGCSKGLTPRFSQSQLHHILLSISHFHCISFAGHHFYADIAKFILEHTSVFFEDSFYIHLIMYLTLFSSSLINFVRVSPSVRHYSGHHQRGCGCHRPVRPLRWGFWRDAIRRVSSYWNQQDAHFTVNRGATNKLLLSIYLPDNYLSGPGSLLHSLFDLAQLSRLSSGSFDELWHSGFVWFTLYTQWQRWGQH